jgi:hypothetical protein
MKVYVKDKRRTIAFALNTMSCSKWGTWLRVGGLSISGVGLGTKRQPLFSPTLSDLTSLLYSITGILGYFSSKKRYFQNSIVLPGVLDAYMSFLVVSKLRRACNTAA